tara:strand:+ start:218 stop:373 length:156 start_codon:yes stop_codon:yes gene_type:complete
MPSIETLILHDAHKSQFENLGHNERNLILLFILKKGTIRQPKKPTKKAEVI